MVQVLSNYCVFDILAIFFDSDEYSYSNSFSDLSFSSLSKLILNI